MVIRLSTTLPLGLVMLLHGPLAAAQSTLGELLDAGARKLSAAQFKEELVQRAIVGPTEQGGSLEIMYATTGKVAGTATPKSQTSTHFAPINGTWMMGDKDAICTTMTMGSSLGNLGGMALPSRCQFWFKLGGQYFLADSDWDRSSAVLSRAFKQ
jgi:hypothetical protein